MKVLFLDFDGVINDYQNREKLVCLPFVENLKKIINATNAKVVVSSSRKNEFMANENVLHENSYCYEHYEKSLQDLRVEIYDYTPYVESNDIFSRKEKEIEEYLRFHPEIKDFVILDDDEVMKKFIDHQVFLEYSNGLLEEHIFPAIAILNGNLGFYPPNYDRTETPMERVNRIFNFEPFVPFEEFDEIKDLERKLSKIMNFKIDN